MPTAMRPGNSLQASSTKAGFLAAALPRITRRMPASSQAAIPAMSRMPPPSCTGIVTLARIERTAAAFTGLPAKAPFRSTTCSQENPAACQALCLRTRIVGIDRRLIHLATAQPDALSVFEVDRRIQRQGGRSLAPSQTHAIGRLGDAAACNRTTR